MELAKRLFVGQAAWQTGQLAARIAPNVHSVHDLHLAQ